MAGTSIALRRRPEPIEREHVQPRRRLLPQSEYPVREAVLETLTMVELEPDGTGKRLLGRLEGLWSARVGSYRIANACDRQVGTHLWRAGDEAAESKLDFGGAVEVDARCTPSPASSEA